MYEIILKTWYGELKNPNKTYDEVYDKAFKTMEKAVKYLSDNIETILDKFPVDGEIKIKYNKKRTLNNN